ncbi:hypothetical protein [Nioella halotolerans]|uniref:hypothetical protein n=1 Tax=Nioella halotolerans TaxID=2303578 RepID=UPI003F65ABE5
MSIDSINAPKISFFRPIYSAALSEDGDLAAACFFADGLSEDRRGAASAGRGGATLVRVVSGLDGITGCTVSSA